MSSPRVWNKRRPVGAAAVPADAVYIGRPSKWGNPFAIGPDGTRAEVIARYRAWLLANPDRVAGVTHELAGKDLVCFCAPLPCHGDVLLQIANGLPDQPTAVPKAPQIPLF